MPLVLILGMLLKNDNPQQEFSVSWVCLHTFEEGMEFPSAVFVS